MHGIATTYIVTQPDTELDQILEQDQDLFFFNVVVEVNMGNTIYHTPNKIRWTLCQ